MTWLGLFGKRDPDGCHWFRVSRRSSDGWYVYMDVLVFIRRDQWLNRHEEMEI